MNRTLFRRSLAGVVALGVMLSACGGGGDDTASPNSTATTVPSDSADSSSSTATVDANSASVDEMTAAFEAAGVDNAQRWAREVEEYRPYDVSDNWAKLRDELSKYNIDEDTFSRIISALTV